MANAWQQYISNMTATGLKVAGIYGMEGGTWATSDNFKASQAEIAAITAAIKSGDYKSHTFSGIPFMIIGRGSDFCTCKGRDASNDQNNYLLHVALGKTCVIVGGMLGSDERKATVHVENIRDYLVKMGY